MHQVKLNIDGAFIGRFKQGGIGGIFRKSIGEWILGFSKKSYGPSPLYMELVALCYGLKLAKDYNLTNLQIETDSTSMPSIIETNNYPPYNTLISTCRYWLKMLGNPSILHNFHEGNKVAHELAQHGVNQTNVYYNQLYPDVLDYLRDVIKADKEGISTTRSNTTNVVVLNSLAMLGNALMPSFGCNNITTSTPMSAPNGRTRPCIMSLRSYFNSKEGSL
ncbi:uncharacterized protein LOC142180868 [Nicotiana tabacum]|uniref:Uncharacterized protein LOC142180868 n=1 Tax=Nicotiana tabacum TaxID=4097 RepID=A0AC58UHV0_TOBAC